MIELSRTQDEEVGDGTTSVIILGMFSIMNEPLFILAQQQTNIKQNKTKPNKQHFIQFKKQKSW